MIIENQSGWRGRMWGWAGRQLARYGGLAESSAPWPSGADGSSTRPMSEYAVRRAYAENKGLYQQLHEWGLANHAMATAWNPVPAVVDFYGANVLNGDLEIEPEQRGTADGTTTSAAENVALAAAVRRVWEWSNFVMLKQLLVQEAAGYGDVLLKVAERTTATTPGERGTVTSVYLQQLPIQSIRTCHVDERGIVQEVRIETPRMTSIFGTADREHVLVEIWRKRWADDGAGGVRFYEAEGRTAPPEAELPSPVGAQTFDELGYDFIPVVWTRCETPWWDSTDQIDYYNVLARKSYRLNVPLGVVRANAMDSEGRPMPATPVDRNRLPATYEEVGDGAAAIMRLPGRADFDWSAGPIDFAALQRDMEQVREAVELSLPEYRVAKIDARSAIAANTLDILLKQATQRVVDMRGLLERALVRAQQMALSLGQAAGLEGFGTADIGSYEAGDLGHVFVERDVFEPSLMARATILKELVAGQIPTKLALVQAGFGQSMVDAYDAAAAEQALRERTTFAAQLARQRALVDQGAADNGLTRT